MTRKITLVRESQEGKAVHGTISFDLNEGTFSYPTLENADYLIPEGTYPIEWTWSPKLKKPLPEILNVPDRSGIRIIRAPSVNQRSVCDGESGADPSTFSQTEFELVYEGHARDPEHSTGCILTNMDCMGNIQVFFNLISIENYYKDEKDEKESAVICITHA